MLQTQPFEVSDFSGGITDNYLDGSANRYKEADNFIVTYNRKLYTRPGSLLYNTAHPQSPSTNNRIGSIIPYNNDSQLFFSVLQELHYIDGVTFETLEGPVDTNPVYSVGTSTARYWDTEWNGHLFTGNDQFSIPMKVYEDNAGDIQVRNAGLPALASNPTVTKGGAGSEAYIYAFVHYYTYQVEDLTFEDFGAVSTVEITASTAPDVNTVNITSIPVLANSTDNNWDTANIKIKIYRTQTNGTVFYEIGEVTNATTPYNDSDADATIITNSTLYITDGSLDRDAPPLCKYGHVSNNVGYYAFIKEASEQYPNRIRMSIPNDVDSCPASLFVDVDDHIIGIGSHAYVPIVICRNSVWRINGRYESDGSGFVDVQKISSTTGGISHNSIVSTREGMFFAGNDGFYVTDGFTVNKVSREFDARYKTMAAESGSQVYGTYDKENSRIQWACQQEASSNENDRIYNLELSFGVRADSCFTSWSDTGSGSFAPTAIAYYNNELIRGDRRGYILKHDPAELSDKKIDLLVTPTDWEVETIVYDYTSCAFDFGTVFVRKFIPRIGIIAASETSLSLQTISINDDREVEVELKPIVSTSSFLWGDPNINWGDPDLIWNFTGIVEEQRRYPANNLRCTYKQVKLTNAYVVITDSDDNTTASLDNGAYTATIDSAPYEWRSDVVDYYLSFSANSFATDHLVTARNSSTVVTYQDLQNLINTTANAGWKLKGKPKNEILNLVGYTIHVGMMGKTQKPFRTGEGA